MKKQTRKVGVSGGFINQLMGNNTTQPKVGEGATVLHYSDREPYEVVAVSDDGNSCTIRSMSYRYTGKAYGDESYEYISNKDNPTKDLEWNEKRSFWEVVTTSIQIQKSLFKKLWEEHDNNMWNNLPNGLSIDDLYDKVHEDNYYNKMKVIEGVTKKYKNFNKISIIFGVMEKYRDPSF